MIPACLSTIVEKKTIHGKEFDHLPQPKAKNSKFSGPVDRSNKWVFFLEITVEEKKNKNNSCVVEEEQACIDHDIYDIPLNTDSTGDVIGQNNEPIQS